MTRLLFPFLGKTPKPKTTNRLSRSHRRRPRHVGSGALISKRVFSLLPDFSQLRAQGYLPKASVPVYFGHQSGPTWVCATQSHLSVPFSHHAVPSRHLVLGPSTYAPVIKELTCPNSHNLNASWSGSRGQMWKRVLTHKVRRSQFINFQPCLSLVTST